MTGYSDDYAKDEGKNNDETESLTFLKGDGDDVVCTNKDDTQGNEKEGEDDDGNAVVARSTTTTTTTVDDDHLWDRMTNSSSTEEKNLDGEEHVATKPRQQPNDVVYDDADEDVDDAVKYNDPTTMTAADEEDGAAINAADDAGDADFVGHEQDQQEQQVMALNVAYKALEQVRQANITIEFGKVVSPKQCIPHSNQQRKVALLLLLCVVLSILGLIINWSKINEHGPDAAIGKAHQRTSTSYAVTNKNTITPTESKVAKHNGNTDVNNMAVDDGKVDSDKATKTRPYRPHILLVIIDDMGSYDLGLHGTGIQTDVADTLAKEGLYLENYYVHPICTPTRIALYTGRFPHTKNLYGAVTHGATDGMSLEDETLPQVLNRAGYRSHLVGKWHVGGSRYEYLPTFRGFQSFFGFVFSGRQNHFTHEERDAYDMRYEKQPQCGAGCAEIINENGNYSSVIFARESIRIINDHIVNHKDEPLFLVLSYSAVHTPIQMPNNYRIMYNHMEGGMWKNPRRKVYAGMLTAADDSLGSVIDALKETNMWGDTLVIYTSDNGAPYKSNVGGSNYPLKEGKATLWEGGIAVDGIIGGPAREKVGIAGGNYTHLMHVVDWLPTLAEIAHVSPNSTRPLDGVSQLSSLRGVSDSNTKSGHGPPARTEIFLGFSIHNAIAHRKDQYKLVWDLSTNRTYLHDIENDPQEMDNLASMYSNMTHEFTRTIAAFQNRFEEGQTEIPSNDCCRMVPTQTLWNKCVMRPWCGREAMKIIKQEKRCRSTVHKVSG